MASIRGYADYTFDGTSVRIRRSGYPIVPAIHPRGKFPLFLMKGDGGSSGFLTRRDLARLAVTDSAVELTVELTVEPKGSPTSEKKTRGKSVVHNGTGHRYGSLKDAAAAHGTTVAKVKTSGDFTVE